MVGMLINLPPSACTTDEHVVQIVNSVHRVRMHVCGVLALSRTCTTHGIPAVNTHVPIWSVVLTVRLGWPHLMVPKSFDRVGDGTGKAWGILFFIATHM